MNTVVKILEFAAGSGRFGIHLSCVDHVTKAVEISPAGHAAGALAGVVNFHGEVVPVYDARKLFDMPARELHCDDEFVVLRVGGGHAVLWVDHVEGVFACAEESPAERATPGLGGVEGVVAMPDGLLLVYDVERLLAGAQGLLTAERGGP